MITDRQWISAAAMGVAAVVVGAVSAVAASVVLASSGNASEHVDDTGAVTAAGWAWQAQRQTGPSLGFVSGVPEGAVAVATAGGPDKLSYLSFSDEARDRLRNGHLTLHLDARAEHVRPEQAALRACLIVSAWQPGSPMAWDARPLTVCDRAPEGTYVPTPPSFTFDFRTIGEEFAAATVVGVAIEPGAGVAGPFQVVFASPAHGGAVVVPGGDSAASPPVTPPSAEGDSGWAPLIDPTSTSEESPFPVAAPMPTGSISSGGAETTRLREERAAPAGAKGDAEAPSLSGLTAALAALAAFPLFVQLRRVPTRGGDRR